MKKCELKMPKKYGDNIVEDVVPQIVADALYGILAEMGVDEVSEEIREQLTDSMVHASNNILCAMVEKYGDDILS